MQRLKRVPYGLLGRSLFYIYSYECCRPRPTFTPFMCYDLAMHLQMCTQWLLHFLINNGNIRIDRSTHLSLTNITLLILRHQKEHFVIVEMYSMECAMTFHFYGQTVRVLLCKLVNMMTFSVKLSVVYAPFRAIISTMMSPLNVSTKQ